MRARRALAEARSRVAVGLAPVGARLRAEGMPSPDWSGRLIRPLVGYAAAGAPGPDGTEGVWAALAAVQLAHEASLLHDDVLDGAASRRGEPTLAASRGAAAALVEGDHLLTAAYRVASWTGSAAWMGLFARAVERTVAGEKAQARGAGVPLTLAEYEAVVLGKSGELLGAALAAGPALRGERRLERWVEAGRRLGLVYQMLDDLLDYCPHVDTGKPALGDYARGLWTWPVEELRLEPGLAPADVAVRLRRPDAGGVLPLRRCADRLRAVAAGVRREVALLIPGDRLVPALLDEWLAAADAAAAALELPSTAGWRDLMTEHARTFRFAARLFPRAERERVMGVYAWCRYTDDLVDRSDLPVTARAARLDAWLELSRRAYAGDATGHDLADEVMGAMWAAGVPFGYAEELIEGMRMDLEGTTYGTLTELYRYSYRVASVVGLWMSEMFGVRDPWMLDRAASLGHAMQLTNILRDVGEDLRAGRLYIPTSWLRAHQLDREALEAMMKAGAVTPAYRELVESLLRVAEREYDHARPAIHRLPDFYRRPVAVAADVYRGIHDEIRAAGYDNLTRRAHTSVGAKIRLGTLALLHGGGEAPAPAAGPKLMGGAALALVAALTVMAPDAAAAQRLVEPDRRAPEAHHGALPAASRIDRSVREVGRVWRAAADEPGAVEAGLDAIASLRSRLPDGPSDARRLLLAYEGSLTMLRARHGGGPRERLRDLRAGVALLDSAVAQAPHAAELRYIRLMSGFHLPRVFVRRDTVEADLSALVRLLPDAGHRFDPATFAGAVEFVLDHGDPRPGDRVRLEALLPLEPL